MGLSLFSGSREYEDMGNYSFDKSKVPDPDPKAFSILEIEDYGRYSVVLTKYDGCTTFDGLKLLLCQMSEEEMTYRYHGPCSSPLDPHLLGGSHPVLARFQPTEEGWALARSCAERLRE